MLWFVIYLQKTVSGNWHVWRQNAWVRSPKNICQVGLFKCQIVHVVPTSWLNYLRRQFVNKFFYICIILSFVCIFILYTFYLLFCLCTFELFFYFVLSLFSFFSFQFYHSTLLTHFKIYSVKICKLDRAEPDFVGMTSF